MGMAILLKAERITEEVLKTVVITMENATERLRGECTRYMIEIKAGVFVGTISAMVRDILWKSITESNEAGGAMMLYSAQNEQGFHMEMHGFPRRRVVDLDGLQLIETS